MSLQAQLLIAVTVASVASVLVSLVWSLMGVWAKWRRGAMKVPFGHRK